MILYQTEETKFDFDIKGVQYHLILQDKVDLEKGINIAKLAVFNAVGSQSINYFRNLDRILNQLPCTIMGMTWHQVAQDNHNFVSFMILLNFKRESIK